jgi:iron complex outermembrane receptor protein
LRSKRRPCGFAPSTVGAFATALLAAAAPSAARAQEIDALRGMSIEDLQNINVTSVSKTDMPLSDAAAAIYVISRDDIIRSGATTIPEMLRLAPNLQIYQTSPARWVATARGLDGNDAAQNFSNKLLVLVDGRTVYTPLFSGVYWDMPDVLPDDVDRIEVISGPGATLWGANAVNGVINIITRSASDSKGLYADVRAGPDRQAIGARISGRAGDTLSYQVHGRYLHEQAFDLASGASADDGWRHLTGGFRLDWTPAQADLVTLEGEMFGARENLLNADRENISGRSLTMHWNHDLGSAGSLQLQAFYDRIKRNDKPTGGGKFHTDTFDVELQHNFNAGAHSVVWGAGARVVDYDIDGSPTLFFDPAHRSLFIGDIFAQDSIALSDDLTLVAGLKAEHLPYSGFSLLPELRLAWKVAPAALLWASAERAVRSATPFDEDVQERSGGVISISGNRQFQTEKLTALEAGARLQPAASLSFSLTAFYHRYDDLRTIEAVPGPFVLNLTWGNQLKGETYGLEGWADWRVARWWTLTLGATVLERDLHFKPGATFLSGVLGTGQVGNDPPYVFKLQSSMNPLPDVTLDLTFRAYGALRQSDVEAYRELSGRLAWRLTPAIAISLDGTNLLHDRHQEYPGGDYIPRRIMGGLELRY